MELTFILLIMAACALIACAALASFNAGEKKIEKPVKNTEYSEEMKAKFKEAEERAAAIFKAQQEEIRKNREEMERNRQLDAIREMNEEKIKKTVEKASAPAIKKDPEKTKETMTLDLCGPNNRVNYISPAGSSCLCSIRNDVIKREEEFMTDSRDDAKELIEAIFRTWAMQDDDRLFYPVARFPFKQMRNTYVNVVGMKYREKEAIEKTRSLWTGSMLLLVPDMNSTEDDDAVRVFSADGYLIGYVSAKHTDRVRDFGDGVIVGWMSTTYEVGKSYFSVAIVPGKYKMSQIEENDVFLPSNEPKKV